MSSTKSRSSSVSGKGSKKGDKSKEIWKCTACKKDFTQDSDKIVQCEYCDEFYCSKCLDLSSNQYRVRARGRSERSTLPTAREFASFGSHVRN